jgi:hypothetical protein
MKLYQSITVCLAMIAGVTADGCFAQTAINQQGVVTDGNAPQVSERSRFRPSHRHPPCPLEKHASK